MSDDLMAVEVEIDPMLGASPFRATKHLSVEAARGGKVVDRESEMERRKRHDRALNRLRRGCNQQARWAIVAR